MCVLRGLHSLEQTDFSALSPDTVLDAVESIGYVSDLRVFALNSYENRVYQIGIEEGDPIIAKFYRPGRWNQKQIQEEHDFSHALVELEVPIIAPLIKNGLSIFEFNGYWFSLYPRRGGYAPELEDLDVLYTLGQHLGRIHALGAAAPFNHRPTLSIDSFAIDSRNYLLENDFLPLSLTSSYEAISIQLIERVSELWKDLTVKQIRLHGDCHPGNILARPDSLYLVDLDDARMGPAIQDLWMLISGDQNQKITQMSALLEGYEEFHEFNTVELNLIEPLRTLRLIHYAAWLAKRWNDPAFPKAFPWFNTERYWSEHILELKEQLSALNEPTLKLTP